MIERATSVEYPGDGSTVLFDFNFDGGYLDRTHVRALIRHGNGDPDSTVPVTDSMFVTDYRLRVEPATAVGDTLVIYRQTPTVPLVNWPSRARVDMATLDVTLKQPLFVGAEANAPLIDAYAARDAAESARDAAIAAAATATDVLASMPLPFSPLTSLFLSETGAPKAVNLEFTLPGATGAVPRSMATRMTDAMVSVKDFGALGIGPSNDDRPAFLLALAYCIATGKTLYLPAGDYYFSDHIKPTPGTYLRVVGEHRDLVTIRCAAGRIPFFCDQAVGVDARIAGAHFEGITFDGGHVRTPASFPYNSDSGASMTQALTLRASKGEDDSAHCVITRCRFKDINGLPVWVEDFDGSVEFSFNHVYRTKDPGFLRNNQLKVIGNVVQFGADNGVSVSRANKHIYVAYNQIMDCASAGLFIGGIDVAGNGQAMTLTGATWAIGDTVAVTNAGPTATFNTGDVGINLTLTSGTDVTVVRITQVTDALTASAVVLVTVPTSLRNLPTTTWSKGPESGAQSGAIVHNLIDGTSNYGLNFSRGCKDLEVAGNVVRRAGVVRDSESVTIASMVAGSTALNFESVPPNVTNGTWIMIAPDYTHENYFIAQVVSIVGTAATLSVAAPQTYVRERVRRCTRNTGSYGLVVTGSYTSASILEFAENLNIHDNVFIDCVTGGMRLGSTSGSIRYSKVTENYVFLRNTAHVETTIYGILIGDQGTTAMRTVSLNVYNNDISLNGAGTAIGIEYKPVDSNVASYIRLGPNKIRQCGVATRVTEQTGSTDITKSYMPINLLDSRTTPDLVHGDTIAVSGWATATVAGAVLTMAAQTASVYTPSGPITITDVAVNGAVNHANPFLILRNGSLTAGNNITFTANTSKIRTKGGIGVDIVVPPGGSVWFIPISSTLVQQVA